MPDAILSVGYRMAEKRHSRMLAHPKGFEPLASAFGGLATTDFTRFFANRSRFAPVNELGIDARC